MTPSSPGLLLLIFLALVETGFLVEAFPDLSEVLAEILTSKHPIVKVYFAQEVKLGGCSHCCIPHPAQRLASEW